MENLENSLKFKQWKIALESESIEINYFEEKSTIRKSNGDVLFSMLESKTSTPEGGSLPSIAVLRGQFVSVLVVLHEKETSYKYILMVKQRRVANGQYFYEHPAGMCDSESIPSLVASKEVKEETGLTIDIDKLVPLNTDLLYSSPGLLDESGFFYYIDLELTSEEISALNGKETGASDEAENICLYVADISEAMQLTKSITALLHIYLYLDAIS